MLEPFYGQYIAGQAQTRDGAATFTSINPATGLELTQVQEADAADLEEAIAASRQAFAIWSQWSGAERGRVLIKAAQLLRSRSEQLARLEVADCGKPLYEALSVDIPSAADVLEYYGGLAPAIHGDYYQLGASFAYTRAEPLGICAGIGAWNYPLQIAAWKAAPALAAGNCMIFKPSELTPLTALDLARVLTEAGLPAGAFNVLQGGGRIGRMLCEHPDIAKISLTGSVPTGRAVMAAAAHQLKHVTLELGGKSPLIIFADADIDAAAITAVLANFFTQGEVCSNATRVFVHASVKSTFIAAVQKLMHHFQPGDPMLPNTRMGALISAAHRDKVLSYIASAHADGARLIHGGNSPQWSASSAHLKGGFFVNPTIFDCAHDDMRIVREEIFGPVMSLLTFSEEDEVISRANATHYGLAAGVFTRDLTRAHRVIARLQAGTCWINNYNLTPVEIPFGGFKQSGLWRENGLPTLRAYTQLKSVYVEMGQVSLPFSQNESSS